MIGLLLVAVSFPLSQRADGLLLLAGSILVSPLPTSIATGSWLRPADLSLLQIIHSFQHLLGFSSCRAIWRVCFCLLADSWQFHRPIASPRAYSTTWAQTTPAS